MFYLIQDHMNIQLNFIFTFWNEINLQEIRTINIMHSISSYL